MSTARINPNRKVTRLFLIYGLRDPRNNEIRYVGQSINGLSRAVCHTSPSLLKKRTHTASWLRQIVALGLKPEIVVLQRVEGVDALSDTERFWIAIGKAALGKRFTNSTDGGEGATNWGTPEQRSERARKANAALTPEQRSEIKRKTNASRTFEQRSASARKAKAAMTPERRSEAAIKANAAIPPEKRSATRRMTILNMTPEKRARIYSNLSVTKEQRSDRMRKIWSKRTPEQRSEITRKIWASKTPEQRSTIARDREARKKHEQST